jgi:hypothetical protein
MSRVRGTAHSHRARLSSSPLPWLLLTIAVLLIPSYANAAAIAGEGAPGRSASARPASPQSVVWTDFTPLGWVTAVPFSVSVTANATVALDPGSHRYSISTDGGASWSAWSSTNLTVNATNVNSQQMSVGKLSVPDSASLNYIRFRAVEIGVGEALSQAFLLKVDVTPPAAPQNLSANPGDWTNQNSFTVTWNNPFEAAPVVGAWYKLDSPPAGPNDGKYTATTNSISGIEVGSEGEHKLYVWLQDSLGRANQANASTTQLYLDTTPPEPPTRMTGSPARVWTNVNNFSESWKNPTDLSGVAGAYYKLNALPTSALDGKYVKTSSSISDIQVPQDGRHDIYVWLVDAAGNVDYTAFTGDPAVFWFDATLPLSNAAVTPPAPQPTGWYTSSVSIKFSATDLPDDPAYPPVVYYQLNSGPWTAASELNLSAEGSHRLLYQARDKAGNIAPTREILLPIDKTPPTTTLKADRLPNSSGWYTAPVSFTLSVVDSVSGNPTGLYRLNDGPWQSGGTFVLTAEGSYRIEYYGQDAAGNRSPVLTSEAYVDITPPLTSQAVDGVAGENGWYVSAVTVRLLPADASSGVAATRYRVDAGAWQTGTQFALSTDGIYEAQYYSTDVSGNVETTVTNTLKLDRIPPAAPSGLTASPTGWSRTNAFTVQWISPVDVSLVNAAYVRLSDVITGTPPSGPRDGTPFTQTSRIDSLAVPGEGSYRLYLWLRDTAGNADHKSAPASSPVLRYDATAPTTTAKLQGTEGTNGWFRSSVVVSLTAADAASGVTALRWRVNGGPWQSTNKTTASLTIGEPGKHVVEHYAEDVAGNVGAPVQTTVRIDLAAPSAPNDVQVRPRGWSGFNSYHIEWLPKMDQSGIAGAYVKFNAPPQSATDGTFYPGITEVNGVKVPGEGKHTAYVWLRDNAGNADYATAVAISESMWYDSTSPVTEVTPTATVGLNGWYVEPVTFLMSATDAASGVKEIRLQVDDGPWQLVGERFVLSEQGHHTVRIRAVDNAGNTETPRQFSVSIDTAPPMVTFAGISLYQARSRFDVSWAGIDHASGMDRYDVQVREGFNGPWHPWLQGTRLTSAQFNGERGRTYFFRLFGVDNAGNRQTIGQERRVIVETVVNGGFDTGNFTDWAAGGELFLAVVPTSGPGNVSILAARLGDEDYGASLPPVGMVPVGSAAIRQTIRIPDANQMREPRLQFWYRVQTYDVMFSPRLGRHVDTLDVSLLGEQGNEIALLLRDGNPTDEWGKLYDTGWKFGNIDLRPYAGRTVTLSFANWNRNDNLLNTWSFVDRIQIRDPLRSYLPLAQGAGAAATAAFEAPAGEQPAVPAAESAEEPAGPESIR